MQIELLLNFQLSVKEIGKNVISSNSFIEIRHSETPLYKCNSTKHKFNKYRIYAIIHGKLQTFFEPQVAKN